MAEAGFQTKKRIVCFSNGAESVAMGGGSRYAFEIWSAWSRRNDCELLVMTTAIGSRVISAYGYPLETNVTERGTSSVGASRLGYLPRTIGSIKHALRIGCKDLAFTETIFFFDFLPALMMKIMGRVPRIATVVHHMIPPPGRRSGNPVVNLLAWIENQLLLRVVVATAEKIFVSYPDVEAELRRRGARPDQIVVTGYGLSTLFSDLPAREKKYDAIFVGRFCEVKGLPKLLDAWKTVVQSMPKAKLALVGASAPEFDVSAEIRSRQLTDSNVAVMVGLDDEAVRDALKSSTIFVTASEEEGYGLSVAEALSCGVPCVTFDIPAFRHFFLHGRVVPTDNSAAAFARASLRLLTDAEFRASMSQEAAAGGPFQTWDQVADKMWDALFAI